MCIFCVHNIDFPKSKALTFASNQTFVLGSCCSKTFSILGLYGRLIGLIKDFVVSKVFVAAELYRYHNFTVYSIEN